MQGPTLGQVVPALLMLVLVVATPFVIWNLLEEWSAVYTVTDDGLRYQSLGIDMLIPWSAISATRRIDVEAEESADELLLHEDPTPQISNPLLRMLHVQAYGRRKLAIYAGVEQRDELLAAITRRSVEGSPAAMPVPVSASTDA
ncbi:MAG TPA: hypothetical protein PKA05_00625 [Roseiflexaceae bacterium]|nr:hypothetical protein [Roseiflexaceae bacterium]